MESHFILTESVNGHSLRDFILNFTNNKLSRSFKSINDLSEKSSLIVSKRKNENNNVILEELDTNSFLPTVMKKNKVKFINIFELLFGKFYLGN